MPKLRIQFTGRKRLTSGDVSIVLRDQAEPLAFAIDRLSLERHGLPGNALVRLEAYRRTTYMPFELGTVSNLTIPETDTPLTGFDMPPDGIRFRVKVTSVDEPTAGQLLAEGGSIAPVWSSGGKESLLPVRPEDLDHEVFRLDMDDGPVLLINNKIDQWRQVAISDHFVSLVYPAAFRTILAEILRQDAPDLADNDDWRALWLRLAIRQNRADPLPASDADEADKAQWIDDAVAAFCKNKRTYDVFIRNWDAEAD